MTTAYERRYVKGGKVAHLVVYGQTILGDGQQPIIVSQRCEDDLWKRTYLGTGDQDERERAESLPLCQRCIRVARYGYDRRKSAANTTGLTIVSLVEPHPID